MEKSFHNTPRPGPAPVTAAPLTRRRFMTGAMATGLAAAAGPLVLSASAQKGAQAAGIPLSTTLELDGPTYPFLGFGTHTPLYEKRVPLNVSGLDLTPGNFDRLCDDYLSYFSWMRINVCGAEHFHESSVSHWNYPQNGQQARLARMNQRCGGFQYLVTPVSAPSVTIAGGNQTTTYPDMKSIPYGNARMVAQQQAFVGTDENWQIYLEAISAEIQMLMNAGCQIRLVDTPNECTITNTANFFLVNLTASQYLDYVHKVWLGEGMQGGGIRDRYPGVGLVASDYTAQVLGDPVANATATYLAGHYYGDGTANGWGLNTPAHGRWLMTECGQFGNIGQNMSKRIFHGIHDALVYGKMPLVFNWTILRDERLVQQSTETGDFYSAKPLLNLSTLTGDFTEETLWYVWLPYLKACGRGGAEVYFAQEGKTADTSPTFNPAGGSAAVYVTAFRRAEGDSHRYSFVVANGSQQTQTVTLSFTEQGQPVALTGDQTLYTTESKTVAGPTHIPSTTSVTLTLPASSTDNTIVLLEMHYAENS